MSECIVDRDVVPHGVASQPVVRCRDCLYSSSRMPLYCRIWHAWIWNEHGFCYRAGRREVKDAKEAG